MNDRVARNSGRHSGSPTNSLNDPAIDEADHADPFQPEPPQPHRWLITTCVAGLCGSLVIGGALFDLFGQESATNSALASVDPSQFWQRTQSKLKGDFNGEIAQAAETAPYDEITAAAYHPTALTSKMIVVPARELSGGIDGEYPSITADSLPYGPTPKPVAVDGTVQMAAVDPQNITTITKTPPPEPVDETITIGQGESLAGKLVDLGVTAEAARALTNALEPVFPSKLLKEGQVFVVTLDKQQDFYGNDAIFPVRVSFAPGPQEEIVIESDEDGQFAAHVEGAKQGTPSRYAEFPQYRAHGRVGASLYATAKDQGIPDYIISEMMRVYSYDVDFQRQVKAGDEFDLFYGNPITGSSTRRKVLLYASLEYAGGTKTYYRFTTGDGQTDYYDENGMSATKFLLRTPVSGARLTSGFGMRRHPLLGYSRMHMGIDFGVPSGSPIKAAGAGIVEKAGYGGAYGTMVELGHNKKYETLYAHMSRIAEGIRPGVRVKQGQIIGYVGSTGRSTGPHLHYEVRVNDRPVNPLKVRAAGGRQLVGAQLAAFKTHRMKIVAMMKNAPSSTLVAQNQAQ